MAWRKEEEKEETVQSLLEWFSKKFFCKVDKNLWTHTTGAQLAC
jgi:hypothetical protein